ncbi:TonB-dependent receptor [Porticoccus sp. W117]|uniref:TonB-dependent receptor plug domain-containing protein n=1 Tax=Porticoccus sp. W117 TaxID=3054777 RepID=UPI0025923D3F|nr:TonB-dependent receptor [Porticoccus sp. W117]MDM3871908.1 TonB-dependent receptor [Porticoccus sp. W117]
MIWQKCPQDGRPQTLFPLFVVGLFAAPLAADELTEEDLMQEMPMVMAATRLPQSVTDSPGSITVLDRELIAASGFLEIGDLFRLVPGFQVARSWRDHHTVTTYHGQTDGLSRRMQVLVDGRTAFTSQFGLTDWDRLGITVHDIERIEVMRGPAGSAYGSNAFVAAINIVTRKPLTYGGSELFVAAGDSDTQLAGLRYHSNGGKLSSTASATYLGSDGFEGGNSGVNVLNLRWQGQYQLSGERTLGFHVLHADGPSGRGGSPSSLFDPAGDKEIKEQNALLRFTEVLSPNNQWHLQLGLDRTVRGDQVRPGTVAEVLAVAGIGADQLDDYLANFPVALPDGIANQQAVAGPYNYRATRADLEAQQTYSFTPDSRLVWGAGWRKTRVRGALVLNSSDYFESDNSRLFANWEYRDGPWLYNLGGLYEEGDLATGDLSSRLGVNYQLAPNHTLRASFARGWRQPFVGEAYHELALKTEQGFPLERFIEVGEEPLTPEKITTWELGYVGRWGGLRAEVKLFDETLENEIQEVFDPTAPELLSLFAHENGQPPGALIRINGGRTHLQGIEGNIDYRFNEHTRLWLSYGYTSVDQQLPPLAIRGLQHSNSGTPRHTASALLSHRFENNWQASLGYYYLDDTAWYLFGSDTASYDRIDLRLAKTIDLWSQPLKIELIGQNVAGAAYNEFNVQNRFDSMLFMRFSMTLD